MRQFGRSVIIDDLHSHTLGHDRHLRTDVAIADNAERFTPKLIAALGLLQPSTLMSGRVLIDDVAYQDHTEPNDQLGNRTRIRIRCVKNSNPFPRRTFEVDLIDPDAKTTYRKQLVCRLDNLLCYLRL